MPWTLITPCALSMCHLAPSRVRHHPRKEDLIERELGPLAREVERYKMANMPVDLISINLRLLEFSRRSERLERILLSVASGISQAVDYIEQIPPDDAGPPIDDELEVIEGLLGVAFVVCQEHMNGVMQAVVHLDNHIRNRTSLGIELIPPVSKANKKPHLVLLAHACPKTIGTYTHTQVLWALANYFKHKEEFPKDWSEATGGTASTIATISAAGLTQGSTGNLRTGAEVLGMGNYRNLDALVELLRAWGDGIYDEVRKTLGRT